MADPTLPLGSEASEQSMVSGNSQREVGGGKLQLPVAYLALWRKSYRASAWAPPLAKALGVAFLLMSLAGIGAASIMAENGRAMAVSSGSPPVAQVNSAWLKVGTPPLEARASPSTTPLADSFSAASPDEAAPAQKSGTTKDGKVILNQASVEELMKLPGIGKKRAEAIVALRSRLGRFRRPADLLRIRGLGAKRLQTLLPRVVIDPPPDQVSDH